MSLENKKFEYSMLVKRMCIGEFEFVVLSRNFKKNSNFNDYTYQLTQIITESGGRKKC